VGHPGSPKDRDGYKGYLVSIWGLVLGLGVSILIALWQWKQVEDANRQLYSAVSAKCDEYFQTGQWEKLRECAFDLKKIPVKGAEKNGTVREIYALKEIFKNGRSVSDQLNAAKQCIVALKEFRRIEKEQSRQVPSMIGEDLKNFSIFVEKAEGTR
jgi:hypothetical protein